MTDGQIIRREAPRFKLTDPSQFIEWVVGRIEQMADQNAESMTNVSEAITTLLPMLTEQTDLLKEIRDILKWAKDEKEQGK